MIRSKLSFKVKYYHIVAHEDAEYTNTQGQVCK